MNARAKRAPNRRVPQQFRPVDIQVGARLRLRRKGLRLSQEVLGQSVGITFQQLQKYERGANRIGASRLYELSRKLGVPVDFFFGDSDPGEPASPEERPEPAIDCDPLHLAEASALIEAYYSVGDLVIRRRLFQLVQALGRPSADEAGPSTP